MNTIDAQRALPAVPAARPSATPQPAPSDPRDSVLIGRDDPAPPKKWTVLVYSAADNNLESYMFGNLDDAEKVGSDAQTSIVAQFDQGRKGCSRLLINKDQVKGKLNSQVVEQMGTQVDMASPRTLSDFIQWGMKTYPAEHYMLIVSDHGDGWKGCCEDDSAGTWMDLPTLRQGLADARVASGRKLDIVGFDACLMASTEVLHELKDECAYMVGSEETEGANGWPYSHVLNDTMLADMQRMLASRLSLEPRDLAAHVVGSASTHTGDLPTMTAFDMANVPQFTAAVDRFGQAIVATSTPLTALKKLAKQTQKFYEFKDLYDFADRIGKSPDVTDDALKQAAAAVKQAARDVIIAEEHSHSYPNAHGVTIELGDPSWSYSSLQFARDTHWQEAQAKLNG